MVGNKIDLASEREVPTTEGISFAKDNNLNFMETSAFSGDNVDRAFQIVLQGLFLFVFQISGIEKKMSNFNLFLQIFIRWPNGCEPLKIPFVSLESQQLSLELPQQTPLLPRAHVVEAEVTAEVPVHVDKTTEQEIIIIIGQIQPTGGKLFQTLILVRYSTLSKILT